MSGRVSAESAKAGPIEPSVSDAIRGRHQRFLQLPEHNLCPVMWVCQFDRLCGVMFPGRIPASLAGVGRLENMFFMAENGLTAAHQKAKSFL
ncbi:Uncharacterised protein [Klebsiella pneumoniae]|nr:Uncharacterised protein [Klebsiella pneumoniae]